MPLCIRTATGMVCEADSYEVHVHSKAHMAPKCRHEDSRFNWRTATLERRIAMLIREARRARLLRARGAAPFVITCC